MPQSPLPATDGGKVGIWNIARQFALAGHNVQAIFCSCAPKPVTDIPNIDFLPVPIKVNNSPLRIIGSLFHEQSLFVHKYQRKELRQAIRDVMETNTIHIIHADHTSMAPMAKWASDVYGVPWGLRLHNVEWMIWQRYADRFPRWNPMRWYVQSQANKLRWDEADFIRMAPVAFPITDVDKERAHLLAPSTKLVTAPAGVDIPNYDDAPPTMRTHVVMASSWRWVHNVEGLRWFLDHVWPMVRARHADVTFGVLGKDTPSWVNDYADQGVIAEGYVENLYERLHESQVYVAPLFVGSGIRIKVLEALAAGLPVVATTVSAEGITINEQEGLFRCDDAASTASAVIDLLENEHLRMELFDKARSAMQKTYTWQAVVARMLNEYQALTSAQTDSSKQ